MHNRAHLACCALLSLLSRQTSALSTWEGGLSLNEFDSLKTQNEVNDEFGNPDASDEDVWDMAAWFYGQLLPGSEPDIPYPYLLCNSLVDENTTVASATDDTQGLLSTLSDGEIIDLSQVYYHDYFKICFLTSLRENVALRVVESQTPFPLAIQPFVPAMKMAEGMTQNILDWSDKKNRIPKVELTVYPCVGTSDLSTTDLVSNVQANFVTIISPLSPHLRVFWAYISLLRINLSLTERAKQWGDWLGAASGLFGGQNSSNCTAIVQADDIFSTLDGGSLYMSIPNNTTNSVNSNSPTLSSSEVGCYLSLVAAIASDPRVCRIGVVGATPSTASPSMQQTTDSALMGNVALGSSALVDQNALLSSIRVINAKENLQHGSNSYSAQNITDILDEGSTAISAEAGARESLFVRHSHRNIGGFINVTADDVSNLSSLSPSSSPELPLLAGTGGGTSLLPGNGTVQSVSTSQANAVLEGLNSTNASNTTHPSAAPTFMPTPHATTEPPVSIAPTPGMATAVPTDAPTSLPLISPGSPTSNSQSFAQAQTVSGAVRQSHTCGLLLSILAFSFSMFA